MGDRGVKKLHYQTMEVMEHFENPRISSIWIVASMLEMFCRLSQYFHTTLGDFDGALCQAIRHVSDVQTSDTTAAVIRDTYGSIVDSISSPTLASEVRHTRTFLQTHC